MKESTIQIQCVDYLSSIAVHYNDLTFFSIPNEGLMTVLMSFKIPPNIAAKIVNFFKKMGLLPGIPDFEILFRGKCFFVEFKKPIGRRSENQRNVHYRIMASGFDVYTCYSFEYFKKICDDYGIK